MPSIPFVESINVPMSDADIEALPDIWGSLAFTADSNAPVTMGTRPWYEETGTASIFLMGRSGDGDNPVSAAAEEAYASWRAWINPTGNVWVRNASGPRPLSDAIVGNWLVLTVDLSYAFQHRP
jgi:hypothetical protein